MTRSLEPARTRASTLPVTLAELVRIQPLASSSPTLADPSRHVEQVILAETFDRLRRATPHSLVVLHAEAATGGWSLAAALHLAWERNVSALVVSRTVSSPASVTLANRLNMSLIVVDTDPVDVALQLAGLVSAPAAARALRQALLAERLADETGIRGVLGVLNAELDPIPAALVVGDAVVAGRAAAIADRHDSEQVFVDVDGPGERSWARLVAAVPVGSPGRAAQVVALLRIARPSLLAAWAQTRLNSALHIEQERAAFGLLRRMTTGGSSAASPTAPGTATDEPEPVDAPAWSRELGWQVEGANRAVWMAALHTSGEPPDDLTHLLRTAWQRGRPSWPFIPEGDGWISWYSGADPDDVTPVRRALLAFRDTALAHDVVVGVGGAHAGVAGLMRSVAQARLAAHVARDQGAAGVQWFDQVGAQAALAWLPISQIAQVADLCLADLMTAKDRRVLVDTVLAVLDCGGSLSQASQRLSVHRNTVLSRLARARQLGLTYDDPAQRLALHVLCYALASLGEDAP